MLDVKILAALGHIGGRHPDTVDVEEKYHIVAQVRQAEQEGYCATLIHVGVGAVEEDGRAQDCGRGECQHPGYLPLKEDRGVLLAIDGAGSFDSFAEQDGVYDDLSDEECLEHAIDVELFVHFCHSTVEWIHIAHL